MTDARTQGAAQGARRDGIGRKVRVLFPDISVFYGSIARDHAQIMRHLDPEAFDVTLLANSHGHMATHVREMPHVQVKTADLMGDPAGRGMRRRLSRLAGAAKAVPGAGGAIWYARRLRPDIIHGGLTGRLVLLQHALRRATGAKLIVCVHTDPQHFTGPQGRLTAASLRRADMVITVSEWVRQRTIEMGVAPEKVVPILNVVDLDRFNPRNSGARIRQEYGIPGNAPLVVLLGRMFPGKGQGDLVEAIAKVKESVPEIRALIVGWDDPRRNVAGPYSDRLRARCHELGLRDHVILDSPRPDAPEMMAAADIVAAPSRNDPCPLTVVEAMGSGKPLVGYRSGGIPEEVGSQNDEWLVEPGDIDGLAERIVRLARDAGLRERVGSSNRRRAEEHFYEPRLAEENARVYYRLLGLAEETPQSTRAAA